MLSITNILYILVLLWVGWLLLDGLRSSEVWVKGGSSDRFTRELDMRSFAHKVQRDQSQFTYWFHIAFYAGMEILLIYLLLFN